MNNQSITKGKYEHFKGNKYKVLYVGIHTETEEEMVVYIDLENPEKVWIRPLDMFTSYKEFSDGSKIKRFSKID